GLHALTPDGKSKWTHATSGAIATSPAVGADGTVYAGAINGRLHAIRSDGTRAWTYLTGGEIYASPALGADGTIYLVSQGGLVAITPGGATKWSLSATPATNV